MWVKRNQPQFIETQLEIDQIIQLRTYWILLTLFLFVSCCIGCCYFIFIRMEVNNLIKQVIDEQKRNIDEIISANNTNKKQANVSMEVSNKK